MRVARTQIYKDFESLIAEILDKRGIEGIRQNVKSKGADEIDIVIENERRGDVLIEVKIFRTRKTFTKNIRNSLYLLSGLIFSEGKSFGLLVSSSVIDSETKKSLTELTGIPIWDRSSLFKLTEDLPLQREKLESLLLQLSEIDGEDILEDIEDIEEDPLGLLRKTVSKNVFGNSKNRGRELYEKLDKVEAGADYANDFEMVCEEVMKYLFEQDLTNWRRQQRTEDGLNRFDLVCRVASSHDFWRAISTSLNSRYVLFEFKNYEKKIKQGQVYTTEKYLYVKALRSIGFIVTREGADRNAIKAMHGALREHGKLLICLDKKDIFEMLQMKDKGDDYNGYLAEVIDEFFLSLAR